MKILKGSVVLAVAVLGLVVAFEFGPVRQLGTVVLIDERYSSALEQQYYLNGLASSFFACLAAFILKVSFQTTFFLLMVAGAVFASLGQLGDPDSVQYLAGAIKEFMLPFMGASIAMLLVLFGVNKRWPRIA